MPNLTPIWQNSTNQDASRTFPTYVLYKLMGTDDSMNDEDHFNAFTLTIPSTVKYIQLKHIQDSFPLGGAYHFSFRTNQGCYVDITNPDASIPYWNNKIIATITPLLDAPFTKLVTENDVLQSGGTSIPISGPPSNGGTNKFGHFPDSPRAEPDRIRASTKTRPKLDESSGFADNDSDLETHMSPPRYKEHITPKSHDNFVETVEDRSNWSQSSKTIHNIESSAKETLRKQTEAAYEFASKMTVNDAKETAKKATKTAKKWGGSLLSSLSTAISTGANAAAAGSKHLTFKSETIQINKIAVKTVALLGEGMYGQVYQATTLANGETLAFKRIRCQSQEIEHDTRMELEVYRSVKHLNLVPLIDFVEIRKDTHIEFYFLFPYIERGSLWDAIDYARQSSSPLWPFTQRAALHLFHGICAGVLALHEKGYCHRDLKPHNVLLSSSQGRGEDLFASIPLITDFGSCAPIKVVIESHAMVREVQDEADRRSSPPYRAPELFDPQIDTVITGQSDVWSLGCILYAMAFGTNPFENPRDGFMKLACLNGRVTFPNESKGAARHRNTTFSTEFCDFIRDMLHVNPEERPSVLDALEFTEELLHDE